MKIGVGVLGATGLVGQKFVELLTDHPWFTVTALAASPHSSGKKYKDAIKWAAAKPLDEKMGNLILSACEPSLPCSVVFSGLDSSIAADIELEFARAGYCVISNSRNHRMDPDVPLLIPEVNSDHLELINSQRFAKGKIVTNPNCSVIGLAMALKPLIDRWGIEKAHVVTLQALSGAGQGGVAGMPDNVIPFIAGEEEKIETEPLKILGTFNTGSIIPSNLSLSAQCNRVAVADGHTACISVKLKEKADEREIIEAWRTHTSVAQKLRLPLAPKNPLIYLNEESYPQPRLHRNLEEGMAVSIGRLRRCALFDWKFTILSHNMVRGAAGCAILNAELMLQLGYL